MPNRQVFYRNSYPQFLLNRLFQTSISIDILSVNSGVAEHFGSERFDRNLMVVFDQNTHLLNKITVILGQPRSTRYMLQRHSLV